MTTMAMTMMTELLVFLGALASKGLLLEQCYLSKEKMTSGGYIVYPPWVIGQFILLQLLILSLASNGYVACWIFVWGTFAKVHIPDPHYL